MRSVADFLTAGRAAGRYLVATSVGTASFGAITAVMYFEIICRAGVTVPWWEIVFGPYGAIILFLSISGFIIYRYRETRAMTLAQLFEIRYSRRFRILAGSLCFLSGLINFAIFPAVSARFFVNYIGLPQDVMILGHPVPTFGLLMPVLLGFWFAIGRMPFGRHRGTKVRGLVGPYVRFGILQARGQARWEMPQTWLRVAVDAGVSTKRQPVAVRGELERLPRRCRVTRLNTAPAQPVL